MTGAADLAEALARAFDQAGVDLAGVGLGWARLAPTVAVVPAFGLRALPGAARAAMGLVLAVSIAPALHAQAPSGPWGWALLVELARGVPLALSAAAPLWAATMAGGLADAARGSGEGAQLSVLEGRSGPIGALLGLLASAGFLASGGPARVALAALALGESPLSASGGAARVAGVLSHGITLAVAIAAPLLLASFAVDLALGLASRAAAPVQAQPSFAPLRALFLLVALALVLDRLAQATLALGAAG